MTETTLATSRWLSLAVTGAAVVTAVAIAGRLLHALANDNALSGYQATLWWLTYDHGFVRRALPGELLSWLPGQVTYVQMAAAAGLLTAAGAAGLVVLTLYAARPAASPLHAATIGALVLASPFTLTLAVRDIGRYDAVGWLALLAVAGLSRRPIPATATLTSLAVVGAVLTEEFLLGFLLPVVLLLLWTPDSPRGRRLTDAAIALGPGAALAALALASRPSADTVDTVLDRARTAGVLIDATNNAITALTHTIAQQAAEQRYSLAIVAVAAAAVAMSAVGIDFRRWWSLAFIAAVAAIVALRRHWPAPYTAPVQPATAWVAVAVTVVLAGGLAAHNQPIGGPIRSDPERVFAVSNVN